MLAKQMGKTAEHVRAGDHSKTRQEGTLYLCIFIIFSLFIYSLNCPYTN